MNKAFKAYFITCSLLSDFEGFHAMLAEEELFEYSYDLVHSKTTEKDFVDFIKWTFGLKKKHLTRALKNYEKYREDMKDIERYK